MWNISTNELVADLWDYDFGLTFSAQNSLVATTKGGRVNVFSTEGWVLRYSYGFTDPISNVKPKSFSPDGGILGVVDGNNVVFMETSTGRELFALPDECDIRLSPMGTALFTWCYQGELKIWGVIP